MLTNQAIPSAHALPFPQLSTRPQETTLEPKSRHHLPLWERLSHQCPVPGEYTLFVYQTAELRAPWSALQPLRCQSGTGPQFPHHFHPFQHRLQHAHLCLDCLHGRPDKMCLRTVARARRKGVSNMRWCKSCRRRVFHHKSTQWAEEMPPPPQRKSNQSEKARHLGSLHCFRHTCGWSRVRQAHAHRHGKVLLQ